MRSLENILAAAAASIKSGKRRPHCFSAFVPGKGYSNRGETTADDLDDYRRQAFQQIQSEIENMTYCQAYASQVNNQPAKGVLMANWNNFPTDFDRVLEKLGYAVEWSDCYTVCDDCGNAIQTEPDSFFWQPRYSMISECDILCIDCLQDAYPDSEYCD